MRRWIGILIFVGLQSCSSQNREPQLSGMWTLVSMNIHGEDGTIEPFRGGMTGYLMYSEDGHVALHLSDSSFASTSMSFRNFTDTLSIEKLKYLTRSYHYLGKYEVIEEHRRGGNLTGRVQHFKLAHSNPNEWGERVVRRFHLNGDTLVMRPDEKKNASLVLTWYRLNQPEHRL